MIYWPWTPRGPLRGEPERFGRGDLVGQHGRAWQRAARLRTGPSFWNLAPAGGRDAPCRRGQRRRAQRRNDRRPPASPGQRCSRPAPIARSAGTASRSWTGRSTSWSTRSSTGAARPIRLWKSSDARRLLGVAAYIRGGTATGTGYSRSGRHALWAFSATNRPSVRGTYRSTDGGASWTAVVRGLQDGDLVDAALLPDGSLLCGQDVSYRGSTPGQADRSPASHSKRER